MRTDSHPTHTMPLPARWGWARALAICGVAVLTLVAASGARASNRIYWSNYNSDTISWENLDGSAGGQLPTGAATVDGPNGLAIDAATGKVYWANYGNSSGVGTTIGWAMMDGSGVGGDLQAPGATVHGPHGVAIDPVTRRIYWPNAVTSVISWANLDGSGGGDLNDTSSCSSEPRGIAIDPTARKVYWANYSPPYGVVEANLDGSGCSFIPTGAATNSQPEGVALDPVTNRIFWASFSATDTISWAALDGSGGTDLTTAPATVDHPHGVAIDPAARKIYWANADSNVISWANLDGSGGGDIPTPAGANPDAPDQPSLLEVPSGQGAPAISGGSRPGSTLRCTKAVWAADLFSSLLYRAPESLSDGWTRNGNALAGANSRSITVHSVGNYRCVETGSNPAGSTSQRSDSVAIFKVGKAKLNKNKGTAILTVKVPDPGRLRLTGPGVHRQRPSRVGRAAAALAMKVRPGTVKLPVKPIGKIRKRLRRTGSAKVKLNLTYRPSGGAAERQAKKLRLREKS